MEDDKLAIVNRLAQILGESGDKIAAEYTRLVIAQSIVWTIVAALVFVVCLKWQIVAPTADDRGYGPSDGQWFTFWSTTVFKWGGVIFGLVMVASCLPEIYAPRAVAISKLISSLPGASSN